MDDHAQSMVGHVERLTDSIFLPSWLRREHEARYAFCRARVAGQVVIDCGSGEGNGSRAIAAGQPRLLVAVDRSVLAVSLARGRRIEAIAGEAERLGIRDRSASIVVALEVIEHMENPEEFLREAARILRTDGILICSTPNRIVRNPGLPFSGRPLNPWHLREWTPDEFQALLSGAFGEIELFGQQPQSCGITRFFLRLAGVVSLRGAAILRQMAKLGSLIMPARGRYDVRAVRPDSDYEFIVGVCTAPRD
jgi:SAM-dependent methyltransferase